MASQRTVVLMQDPQWFLKLLVASVLLAALLTIASYLVKAQRRTFVLTFPISLAALLAGHFAVRSSLSSLRLLIAAAAMAAILFLGVRYILIAHPLVSVVAVIGVSVLFVYRLSYYSGDRGGLGVVGLDTVELVMAVEEAGCVSRRFSQSYVSSVVPTRSAFRAVGTTECRHQSENDSTAVLANRENH